MKKIVLAALISLFFINHSYAQSVALNAQNNQKLETSVANIEVDLKGIKEALKKTEKLLNNQAMLELFQRIDDLSTDVSQLRGQIEEQEHLQNRLQKRQRELYLDLDRRIREVELKATTQAVAAQVAPIPVPKAPGIKNEKPVETQTKKAEETPEPIAKTEPKQTPKTTPPTMVKKPPVVSPKVEVKKPVPKVAPVITKPKVPMSRERLAYQKAFDLLKEGRYNRAKTSFKAFLLKFPESPYASNAQYWSGEANYVTRQFATALREFKRVITDYPSSTKVPDAMLKLGYTFYETRQMKAARQILTDLTQRYPKSTAARLAGKRLKRMRKEGY